MGSHDGESQLGRVMRAAAADDIVKPCRRSAARRAGLCVSSSRAKEKLEKKSMFSTFFFVSMFPPLPEI